MHRYKNTKYIIELFVLNRKWETSVSHKETLKYSFLIRENEYSKYNDHIFGDTFAVTNSGQFDNDCFYLILAIRIQSKLLRDEFQSHNFPVRSFCLSLFA